MKRKKEFLTIEDVAKLLQIGERSVYRFIESKELKATKIGGWRITKEDLQDFIKKRSNIGGDQSTK
jgi:excisionase family DNA binding protein